MDDQNRGAMAQVQAKHRAAAATGVPNVAYDLMVVLVNKLEGIAAIEEYKIDADEARDREVRALLEEIERADRQSVERLRDLVASRLQRVQQ